MQRLRAIFIILSLAIFANNALAQTEKNEQSKPSSTPAVTASISAGGVRFAAPQGVLQIRLEIYSAAGEVMFDSSLRQGSILDWKVTDATQAMIDGSYLGVVTIMDFQGKLTQRLGAISLQSGQITLKRLTQGELTAAQTQALNTRRQAQKVEATDNSDSLTILRDGKERSVVVTAHDGQDGQVASTSGALTFSTGDIFANRETEQMRVTPDGRVGIGTDKPEATLDVAGEIRTRGGIRFADGSVLTSARVTSGTVPSPTDGSSRPTFSGTGTTGALTKWSDGPNGVAGDSAIREASGSIGIGTTNPAARLHVVGTQSSIAAGTFQLDTPTSFSGWTGAYPAFELVNTNQTNNNVSLFQFSDAPSGASHAGIGAVNTSHADKFGNLFFYTKQADGYQIRMGLFGQNVGIGTTNPANKLEVVGNVKINGAGNGLVFPDGSKMTTAALGGGNTPSGTNIIGAINDPATSGSINDARLSANIARLNGANAWSGVNVFGGGLSANNALITNVGNPVNAGDAVNKAYADANLVRFVPGAEQLSVGDTNGTAPMINLRGGSTCCSGPGGHTPAWFKVFQNGSFVATGNLGIGVSPMQGKGYRTSWDAYKGAFRSGYADNEWDDATVGFFSWAGGSNSTAEGLYAFAFGDTNFARSTSSIAFGSGNEVKGGHEQRILWHVHLERRLCHSVGRYFQEYCE
jgi:hypothetical protein